MDECKTLVGTLRFDFCEVLRSRGCVLQIDAERSNLAVRILAAHSIPMIAQAHKVIETKS
jgi:hypothetical protein